MSTQVNFKSQGAILRGPKLVDGHVALDAADALLRSQQIAGRDRPLNDTPGAALAQERGTTEPGIDRPSGSGTIADPEGDTSDSDCETPSPSNQQRDTAANAKSSDRRSTRNQPSQRDAPYLTSPLPRP